MKTPGTMLREAREAMGLSLKDVAAMTRIPQTMLAHLERDRYDEYSADVFARGHLRNYAREMKLDPETVIQAFDRYTGRLVVDEVREESASSEEASQRSSGGKVDFKLAGQVRQLTQNVRAAHMVAVALVLVALFVVFSVLTGSRATAKDPAKFPSADEEQWEMEKETQETRWLLEQPANAQGNVAESSNR